MARPSEYTTETALRICEAICERDEHGQLQHLHAICKRADMPGETTVYAWLGRHEEFAKMYARAREVRADMLAEDVLRVADGAGLPEDKRVRVEARKWYAAKLNPRNYGDRVVQEHVGKDGAPIEVKNTSTDARRAALLVLRAAQAAKRAAQDQPKSDAASE